MELRHLRYFVAVAELGSFTRASQALFVAQPPLSQQIRDLEQELGAQLLVRHVRGISLTAAGETLLAHAREVPAQAEHLKRAVAEGSGGAGGPLRMGFIPSASAWLLPRVLPALRAQLPDVALDVRELLSSEQIAGLQAGTLDLALCRPPVRAKTLAVVAELSDPFCLALPAGHALAVPGDITLAAAAGLDFVTFKRDQARAFFDQTLNFCTAAGFSPVVRCEAGTVFGVLHLVAAGMGVAIVPASAAAAAPASVVLRQLVRPQRPGALLLVRRKVDRNPAVGALVELVQAAFGELNAGVQGRLGGAVA